MWRNRTGLVVVLMVVLGAVFWFWPRQQGVVSASTMVDVSVPDLNARESDGRIAFIANCAECHGESAGGKEGLGPPLVHGIYEPSHHANAAFVLAARNGSPQHHWSFGNMPSVEGITDREIRSIIAYVRRLQEANGIY